MIIIFDGPRDCARKQVRITRMQNQLNDVSTYFGKLHANSGAFRPKGILPIFGINACARAFVEAGADVRFATAEADPSIVRGFCFHFIHVFVC